ncbi:hypothetical protein [Cryptosporangium sp. NPDC051539]|uniref:hypothetical protein n=1 Tax=Cryptosporangium sp. NPDC051539 TaxID=3363962 RepID=UPI0037A8AE93
MIPNLITVRHRRAGRRWHRLYVPILPLLLVLSPLLVIAVVGGLITCRVFGINPLGALRSAGQLFWALPGVRFEIEQGRTAVLVSVR